MFMNGSISDDRMQLPVWRVIYSHMRTKQTIASGQSYNKLTALEPAGKTTHGKNLWLFQCECGRRTTATVSQVLLGKTKSCGCLRTCNIREVNGKRKLFPIVGKIYGQLTAIEDAHEKTKDFRSLWWFQCGCGQRIKTAASLVIYGNKRSCGCLAISMRKGRAPFASEDDIAVRIPKRVWQKTYSDGCPFDLFMILSQEPCHYCGASLSNTASRKYTDGIATFTYNGLDRKDSTKDHSPENVIPCCRKCNIAKNNMTYEEFIVWNARVYLHTTHVRNSLDPVSLLLANRVS